MAFKEIAETWFKKNYDPRININLICSIIGSMDITDVSEENLKNLYSYLYDEVRLRGTALSYYESAIDSIFQFALENDYISEKPKMEHRTAPIPNLYNKPDDSKMRLLLSHEEYTPEGTIIRLALFCGLLRNEITYLTWPQVDYKGKQITLDYRNVPLDDDILSYLHNLKRKNARYSEYVLVSQRKSAPLAEQSVSALARKTLDSYGMTNVRLNDLRIDFIIRALQEYPWEYVSYLSGVDLQTLEKHYIPYVDCGLISHEKTQLTESTRAAIKNLISEENSMVCLAIRFVWQMGIPISALPLLTWDIIDFKRSAAIFKDRIVTIPNDFFCVLKNLNDSSNSISPYIILNEKNNTTDQFFIQKAVQQALIKRGIIGVTLPALLYDYWDQNQPEIEMVHKSRNVCIPNSKAFSVPKNLPLKLITLPENRLVEYLKAHKFADQKTLKEVLAASDKELSLLLKECQNEGKIIRVGRRFFLSDQIVPPQKQESVICQYIKEHGFAKSADLTKLLGLVGHGQIYKVINPMLESGKIIRAGMDNYRIPEQ